MATVQQPSSGKVLLTGIQAGAIALVIRMLFALTLERMSFGAALSTGLLFFVGTALVTMAVMLVIVRTRGHRSP